MSRLSYEFLVHSLNAHSFWSAGSPFVWGGPFEVEEGGPPAAEASKDEREPAICSVPQFLLGLLTKIQNPMSPPARNIECELQSGVTKFQRHQTHAPKSCLTRCSLTHSLLSQETLRLRQLSVAELRSNRDEASGASAR